MQNENKFDAIIIGGGPAGSSSAAILAENGHRVLVLEREKFPRYHIGESLLPFNYFPLKRLGLIDKMRRSQFVKKYSVQFIAPSGKASQPFYFNSRYDKDISETWQVLRSEFDELLLNNAREKGAVVMEEMTVMELIRSSRGDEAHFNPERETRKAKSDQSLLTSAATGKVIGVRTKNKSGEVEEFFAPITLDCTGKESFAAVRNGWRVPDPYLKKVAVWTYYKGAKRDAGIDEGATTVAFVPEKGWFWYIPQHNDMVSVGVVAEGKYLTRGGVKDLSQIFAREVKQNLWIKEYLSCGEQVGKFFVTNEFSFHSRHCASDGLLLVGDAFCFLDPVFSSGVMLALKSGVMAGEIVSEAIKANDFSPARFESYGRYMREGIENMRKLVYAFYDPDFSFKKVIDKYPELKNDITDCLSGDVNKDFSKLWCAVREFCPVPDDLPYGQPLENPVANTIG
ncbi:MAG: NAD(P)/FAD-dependent oxidoreductase [Verrucomicrobiota bacterium]